MLERFYWNKGFILANQRFISHNFLAFHRGQPAAKCHPRWQPTRRLAVSCGLRRHRIQTQDCRTTVRRATTEPPCLPHWATMLWRQIFSVWQLQRATNPDQSFSRQSWSNHLTFHYPIRSMLWWRSALLSPHSPGQQKVGRNKTPGGQCPWGQDPLNQSNKLCHKSCQKGKNNQHDENDRQHLWLLLALLFRMSSIKKALAKYQVKKVQIVAPGL